MQYIAKFDFKYDCIRMDLYIKEGVRVSGRVMIKNNPSGILTLQRLFLQLNDEFEIGFKKNNRANITHWLKKNIIKVHIRQSLNKVPKNLEELLLKFFKHVEVRID